MYTGGPFEKRNRFWLSYDVGSIDELLDAGFAQSFDLFVHEQGAPYTGFATHHERSRALSRIIEDIAPLLNAPTNVAFVRNEGEPPYVQSRSRGQVQRFLIDRYIA